MSKAEEMRRLRNGLGFTLADVAGRIGLSIATLHNMETGKRGLNPILYSKVLVALGELGEERERNGRELMEGLGFGKQQQEMAGMEAVR